MTPVARLATLALALAALAGCREGDEDAPAKSKAAAARPAARVDTPPRQLMPYEVPADAIAVGTTLNGNTVVRATPAQFTTADTVYAGAAVKGAAPGAKAVVYWTYQDGRATQEAKTLEAGQESIWFSFSAAQGMKPGKYNVEIDVNTRPIGIVDFEVR